MAAPALRACRHSHCLKQLDKEASQTTLFAEFIDEYLREKRTGERLEIST